MGYLQPLIFFVLVAFPFMFISPSLSSLDHDHVTLSLYYETLCPYCASFISNDLVKVFRTDLYTIVNLRLVPWGNADVVGDTIRCQHGEDECYLNAIDSCVIHLWPDVKKHFDFIRCTEEQRLSEVPVNSKEAMWRNCSDQLGLRADMINKCYTTGLGIKDFENFVKYVCDAYQGDPKPEACKTQSSSVGSTLDKIAKNIHQGCYASEFLQT
ncbi:gamma-interferon-responsive lysosomal thiol protein-like isoform X2 [Hibiscus syriacus]|uniref:gamma-interferon-responsive lysosomal thiol protein-like isoform X2 n=1 Tax=Hibiscus syriacus TaxID=106335 RepID=UPI001920C683|nr:gamma-interferon-responsive lysosomal thiol protein-like isoform X2 [Hibiscus syriacus]